MKSTVSRLETVSVGGAGNAILLKGHMHTHAHTLADVHTLAVYL